MQGKFSLLDQEKIFNMKKLILSLLIVIFIQSCHNNKNQVSITPPHNPKIETQKEVKNFYEPIFYNSATRNDDIENFIKDITKKVPYLRNVDYDPKNQILTYYVCENKESPYKDFYALSKIDEFDWTFLLLNDMYKASFNFVEVQKTAVYDISNKKFVTFLPAKSDVLYLIEGNYLDAHLFVADYNYNQID